jgi:hypothetical protein
LFFYGCIYFYLLLSRMQKLRYRVKPQICPLRCTLWWDAICKEMRNVQPAFEKWEKKEGELPPAYQKIKCHFMFDIKMGENFRRKARLVVNGNETETPASLTYSSVVSRDLVRMLCCWHRSMNLRCWLVIYRMRT